MIYNNGALAEKFFIGVTRHLDSHNRAANTRMNKPNSKCGWSKNV